jgi:fatty-acid desaturase
MQLGSTSRNINFLTIGITVTVISSLFNPAMFTLPNVLITIVSFYVLNILGTYMMLHRYFSHKSFEFKNDLVKWLFTLVSILSGRGSPLGWAYIHRKHHAYSDDVKDPHSPKNLGYKLFGFGHIKNQEGTMQIFMVKDLMTKEQLFIHKWYMAIILSFIFLLGLVSLELLFFIWILPVFLVQVSQTNFNYFGHMSGYRNFDTKDDSRNNVFLFPFILGEAWHNNHHKNAKDYSTTVKPFEIDPLAWFIKIVGR